MVAFSLFTGIAFFVDIAHYVLDHLLWNHVYNVLEPFFQSIDNWWLLLGQVNHGIRTEELKEVGTIWEYLDLGFAAEDTVLKQCIEERPDFCCCVAHRTTLHFPEIFLAILCISGQSLFFYIYRFAEQLMKIANGKYRTAWWVTQRWKLLRSPMHIFRPVSSLKKPWLSGPHTTWIYIPSLFLLVLCHDSSTPTKAGDHRWAEGNC